VLKPDCWECGDWPVKFGVRCCASFLRPAGVDTTSPCRAGCHCYPRAWLCRRFHSHRPFVLNRVRSCSSKCGASCAPPGCHPCVPDSSPHRSAASRSPKNRSATGSKLGIWEPWGSGPRRSYSTVGGRAAGGGAGGQRLRVWSWCEAREHGTIRAEKKRQDIFT
jgi:hypothetical protein